jgi:hypothetical protein
MRCTSTGASSGANDPLLAAVLDDAQHAALLVGHRFRRLVGQHLDVTQHAGKRAAQLARNLGQELVLRSVEDAQPLDHLVLQLERERVIERASDLAGESVHQRALAFRPGPRRALLARDEHARDPRPDLERVAEGGGDAQLFERGPLLDSKELRVGRVVDHARAAVVGDT